MAGYMSRLPALPSYISGASFVSFTRWGLQGLVLNQFGEKGDFIDQLGFNGFSPWTSIFVLLALVVAFRVGMVFFTYALTFEKR